MSKNAAQRRPRHEPIIPDKLYFRIGEVARLCGVETYVLRFWETEFPQMRPNKSGTGQRLYRKRDVELAMRVRRLLHDEGYTIAGARQVLAHENARSKSPQLPLIEGGAGSTQVQAKLKRVRTELRELLGMLSAAPARKPRATDRSRPNLFE
jgi:DNA-binding transcriptional MerR regulator